MIIVKFIAPYIKMIRPVNAAMTACAVLLGMWLTAYYVYPVKAALLMLAAAAVAGYGNVVNDILDVESDRISHPDRPLARGAVSDRAALVFAAALALGSLAAAVSVSRFHAAAALLPIGILTLYSIYFKRTRIVGNFVVAALTAYALLYGSLPRNEFTKILFAPAMLAFLLNFCREMVKDVQDAAGDKAAGWKTTADLPSALIKTMLVAAAAIYLAIVLLPSVKFGHFGPIYTWICIMAVIPIHIYWVLLVLRSDFEDHTKKVGTVLKVEMVVGLLALAFDKGVMYI